MDGISRGRQEAREAKSKAFHESLLSSVVFPAATVQVAAQAPLSVRDKIIMGKSAKFREYDLDN